MGVCVGDATEPSDMRKKVIMEMIATPIRLRTNPSLTILLIGIISVP